MPWARAHQLVLPPETKPGFSTNSIRSTAWACVSTSRSGSATGCADATPTGSAVPVTSTMMPGVTAPAPMAAA